MAKLFMIKGSFAAIEQGQGPNIIRDIVRNDKTPRVVSYVGENEVLEADASELNALASITSKSRVGVYLTSATPAAGAEVIELTQEKSGNGVKVSWQGKTADEAAELAYGEARTRTTFASFQDFVRLVQQNAAIEENIAGLMTNSTAISAIVVDQVNKRTFAVGDSSPNGPQTDSDTFYTALEFDDASGAQYGE